MNSPVFYRFEVLGNPIVLTKAQEGVLARLQQVLTNVSALAISFRKQSEITSDFLAVTPDFDYEALDVLRSLCNKSQALHKTVLQSVVREISKYFSKKCVTRDGSRALTGRTTVRPL